MKSLRYHHDDGVDDAHQLGHHQLRFRFGCQAHDHEQEDGNQVQDETCPLVNLESRTHGSDNHQEDGARTDDRTDHQQNLKNSINFYYTFDRFLMKF